MKGFDTMFEIQPSQIRILGIAPYEGMKALMMKVAEKQTDISLTVYIGNRLEGLEIVRSVGPENFDVIISRGGTAEIIAENVTTPTVAVEFSAFDILRTLKLVENYHGRYAIIGFPAITKGARMLCDLLQHKLDIFTIHNEDEIIPLLRELQQKGYTMFISDTISDQYARQNGMSSILLTSGTESMEEAFHNAIQLCQSQQYYKSQVKLLQAFLASEEREIVIHDESHSQVYAQAGTMTKEKSRMLFQQLQASLDPEAMIQHRDGQQMLTAWKVPFQHNGISYVGYQCQAVAINNTRSTEWIQTYSRHEVVELFLNEFHGIPTSVLELTSAWEAAKVNYPPMLMIGCRGTGLEQAAAAVYTQSCYRDRPLYLIKCQDMDGKAWNRLLDHADSPMAKQHITLLFQHAELLTELQIKSFISYAEDASLFRRNHVIFTYEGDRLSKQHQDMIDVLTFSLIRLAPLKTRVNEIPALANLYVSSYNSKLAKQIVGFQAEALRLLEEYDWPGNLLQFRRIVYCAVSVTEGSYVTVHATRQALANEETENERSSSYSIDFTKPLAQIELDIVRHVLAQCGGSQSKAAQQLQIGRSTLWRMLKEK